MRRYNNYVYQKKDEGVFKMNNQNKIYFYSRAKEFFELSNFSHHPIIIDGLEYKTNEHYFQSIKFIDKDYQEKIRLSTTPRDAKYLGSSRKFKIHSDWDERRIDVMKKCVKAKFTQHESLKKLLLSTQDSILIEDSPSDTFWGCGRNKNGKNMLGKILMELREEFRKDNKND